MIYKYIISYDVHSSDLARKRVADAIEGLGKSRKILTTTYLLVSYHTIEQVQVKVSSALEPREDFYAICTVDDSRIMLDLDSLKWLEENFD